MLLQFNDFRIDQRKEPCIRVNTRELNGVLSTMYLPLYILTTNGPYSTISSLF